MKRVAYIFLLLLTLGGCRSKKPIINVPMRTVERKVSTLIPFYIPGDSALLQVILECDSLNNVLLSSLSESKGDKVASGFEFKDGIINYNAQFKPDTVYVPSDTIYTSVEIPLPVEVKVVEYRQTKFQNTFYNIGLIAVAIFIGFILTGIKNINFLKLK